MTIFNLYDTRLLRRRRQKRTNLAITVSILAVMTAASDLAIAQVDELVVTARKRNETLQTVPLSVQAFSAEQISASDISSLADLQNFAPGVSLFENIDRGYSQVFIRGMSNVPPVGDTTRELTSIFLDGIYYVGGVSGINTNNIERIEVVKGPQSALYGRATFSGAINFITKTPGDEFSGNLQAKVASDEEYEINGSVEGPIVKDVLSARISGRYREFGGQYENSLNGAALGEQEDASISGQLFLEPSDRISVKTTAMFLTQDDGPPASILTGKVGTHNFTSASGTTFFQGEVPQGPIAQNTFPTDPNQIFGTFCGIGCFLPLDPSTRPDFDFRDDMGTKRDFFFASVDLNWDLGQGYVLNYLGGYSDEESTRLADFELSAEDNYYLSRRTDADSWSHELRLTSPDENRFRWLLGLYYLESDRYVRDPGGIFGVGVFGGLGLPPGSVFVGGGPRTIVDRKIENKAVFASASFDITDELTVSAEGRYQIDEITDTIDRVTGEEISGETKEFLPRVIVEYQATDDILLYALVAKGIRPTTVNGQFAGRTPAQQALIRAAFPEFEINILAPKETIWSYEIGAKTSWLDDRIIFNINGYYADWRDQQVLQSLFTDIDGDMLPDSTLVTTNGTDVEAYGIEIESRAQVTDNFYAGIVASWNHTSLTDAGVDSIIARFFLDDTPNGERLPQVPEFAATLIAEYRMPILESAYELYLRSESVYVGSRFASTLNLAETGDSFDQNLRLGVENERFSVGFFVENLFQDETFESLRSNADCATTAACTLRAYEAALPKRRQYGITASINF